MPCKRNNLHKRILNRYLILCMQWAAILIGLVLRHYRLFNMRTILFVQQKMPEVKLRIYKWEDPWRYCYHIHFHSIYVNKQCIITQMNGTNRQAILQISRAFLNTTYRSMHSGQFRLTSSSTTVVVVPVFHESGFTLFVQRINPYPANVENRVSS
jgi:hypothetical protein